MSAHRVATILGQSLLAHGVDRVFCVPGESYLGFSDALNDLDGIELIVCRHEGSAGFMAIADGQLCGRPGVYVVSRGPGMANGMIALHSALHDTTPLVVLVGHVERADVGRMALQEQNYSRLLADVTKSVIEVTMPAQASEAVARAFRLAQSGTPGPVAIILPEDIFDLETDHPVNRPRPAPLMAPGPAAVEALATRLAQAERPAGVGRWRDAGRRSVTGKPGPPCGELGRCRYRPRSGGRSFLAPTIRTTPATSPSGRRHS